MLSLSDEESDDVVMEEHKADDPSVGRFGYQGDPTPQSFNHIAATDNLD